MIKYVTLNEYESLMELMNKAFNFTKDKEKFEHILPKLYFKDNKEMIHIGKYEDNKLVASIGLYPMTLISKYGSLNIACVGAVSTHPDYRNKGYFSLLIKEILKEAKKQNYDLLFLGGNRVRYGHYGFENGGLLFRYQISNRSFKANEKNYSIKEMSQDDVEECLALYNKQDQYVLRTKQNFIDHTKSWNCTPYVVLKDNELIGYFAIDNNNHIDEFIYKDGRKDDMYSALIKKYGTINMEGSIDEFNEDTLAKCDWYGISNCEMYKILNIDNVAKYLNFEANYKDKIKGLDERAIVRYCLGDGINKSQVGETMFILRSNHG